MGIHQLLEYWDQGQPELHSKFKGNLGNITSSKEPGLQSKLFSLKENKTNLPLT